MNRLLFIPLLFVAAIAAAQSLNADYIKYIEQYKQAAVDQEISHGIPATITLAQGLLESGAGKSRLALEANNHFGIKCHSDWTGDTIRKTDDAANECFRKYERAEQSFEDHALFLLRPRYQQLFGYDVSDYKSWARGLKQCGYATDPNYAAKLIKIIDDYDLVAITQAVRISIEADAAIAEAEEAAATDQTKAKAKPTKATRKKKPSSSSHEKNVVDDAFANAKAEEKAVELAEESARQGKTRKINPAQVGEVDLYIGHEVHRLHGAKYVVAEAGDTYKGIAAEFNIELRRICRYNGVDEDSKPRAGEKIFLNRKKK